MSARIPSSRYGNLTARILRGSRSVSPLPPCGRRKSIPKCRSPQEVPPSGSYRLRRHFPRLCNLSTRARHSYRVRSLRDGRSAIRDTEPANHEPALSQGSTPSRSDPPPPKGRGKPAVRRCDCGYRSFAGSGISPPGERCYQLALVTPGISPLEAISRNWIRLMPNRRM